MIPEPWLYDDDLKEWSRFTRGDVCRIHSSVYSYKTESVVFVDKTDARNVFAFADYDTVSEGQRWADSVASAVVSLSEPALDLLIETSQGIMDEGLLAALLAAG